MGVGAYFKNVVRALLPGFWGVPGRRRYEGADRGRRTSNFPLNNLSPNKDIGMDATLLRQRAKFLYQNTPYAKRAINGIANAVTGLGIIPTFAMKGAGDGATSAKYKKIEDQLKGLWEDWGETKTCDFFGRMDFYGLTNLVAKTYKRDGECLILRRRVSEGRAFNGLQLQVLEMEYLADYINYQVLPGGGWTMNGIQYDKHGRVEGYWLFHRHPSEWWTLPELYPSKDVIHVFDVDYPAQGRGVPGAAPTIVSENDLKEYEDAELMGKKVQASFAMFRVTNDPEKIEGTPDPDDYDKDEDLERIEPGSIYHLFPGEQVQSSTPPTAPGAEDYRKAKQRNIAAGYETTYEMMTGDYSMVNFSSGRMGWIEFQRNVEQWQWRTIVPQFCDVVMGWFMEQVPLTPGSDIVEVPRGMRVTWTTPRREMIDPVKETIALKNMLRTGLKSYPEVIKMMGDDPARIIRENAAYIELCKKAGVHLEWSPDLDQNIATPGKMKGEASV